MIIPSGRFAAASAIAGIALWGASGFLSFAAADFRVDVLISDPREMVARGLDAAELIRWGSVVDLIGYLAFTPLVLYCHERFKSDRFIALYSFAGLSFILIGAAGAIILEAAAPQLMRSYQSALASEREAITTDFVTVYLIVTSLWQALQTIPSSFWLLGIGGNFLRGQTRPLGLLLLVLAALAALSTVWRLLTI